MSSKKVLMEAAQKAFNLSQIPIEKLYDGIFLKYPAILTSRGLEVYLESTQNKLGSSVVSQDYQIEIFMGDNGPEFHAWNKYGVITSKPILIRVSSEAFTKNEEDVLAGKGYIRFSLYIKESESIRSMSSRTLLGEIAIRLSKIRLNMINKKEVTTSNEAIVESINRINIIK